MDAQLSKLANQITITQATGTVPSGGAARPLTDQDVASLQNPQQAPDIVSVTPSMTGTVALTAGTNNERASMVGATYNYLDIVARDIAVGNWFTADEVHGNEKLVVLGQQAISYLWGPKTNMGEILGRDIRLNRTTFKIIGVLTSDGQNDNVAIVPFGAARSYLVGNANQVNQIIVKSTSASTVGVAQNQLTQILDARHFIRTPSERDYNVRAFQNLIEQRTQFISFLTLFTAAVAAISLIVGGIGVANIMLVSVTERTREIGILKSLGASKLYIINVVLRETVLLAICGIVLGIVVSVAARAGLAQKLPLLRVVMPFRVVSMVVRASCGDCTRTVAVSEPKPPSLSLTFSVTW